MKDYVLGIGTLEPCGDCGKRGPHPLRWFPADAERRDLLVLCDRCLEARYDALDAERERARLAEWGTLGQRRQA